MSRIPRGDKRLEVFNAETRGQLVVEAAYGGVQVGMEGGDVHSHLDREARAARDGRAVVEAFERLEEERVVRHEKIAIVLDGLPEGGLRHIQGHQDSMQFILEAADLKADRIPFLGERRWGESFQVGHCVLDSKR